MDSFPNCHSGLSVCLCYRIGIISKYGRWGTSSDYSTIYIIAIDIYCRTSSATLLCSVKKVKYSLYVDSFIEIMKKIIKKLA